MGQGEYRAEGMSSLGRSKPHFTYSRKSNLKKNKGPDGSFELIGNQDDDDNDDDNSNFQLVRIRRSIFLCWRHIWQKSFSHYFLSLSLDEVEFWAYKWQQSKRPDHDEQPLPVGG